MDTHAKYFSHVVMPVLLKHEGGFVNDSADPGGATNYGISLRFLQKAGELDLDGDGLPDGDIDLDGDIDADDIRHLTSEQAAEIYRQHWWEKYRYQFLPWPVSGKTMDLSVNMGPRQAHKCLQRAVRAAGGALLVDDGILGPKSLQACRMADPNDVHVALCSEAAGFYRALVIRKPALSRFLSGWLNRAYSMEFVYRDQR